MKNRFKKVECVFQIRKGMKDRFVVAAGGGGGKLKRKGNFVLK